MNDYVIDTNVLLLASATKDPVLNKRLGLSDSQSKLAGKAATHIGNFSRDPELRLVLDGDWSAPLAGKIYHEYKKKQTMNHLGLLAVQEKLRQCAIRPEHIKFETDGTTAEVPPEFNRFDRADRKFLACALNDPKQIEIHYACDRGWGRFARELKDAGVTVKLVGSETASKAHKSDNA